MDDLTSTSALKPKRPPCTEPVMLYQLREGQPDKLGHQVEEMLWAEKNYAIYRTTEGINIQFSDNEQEAHEQRRRFTKICPELCELRYLTAQIRKVKFLIFPSPKNRDTSSLYDHNIAQAMMLVMERDLETGKRIAQKALNMAVERAANDNTIRYVCASLACWALILVFGAVAIKFLDPSLSDHGRYLIAGIGGASGAMLSIATRVRSFRLKPCHQSDMNYWVSVIRIGIGAIAGFILLLIAPTVLSKEVRDLIPDGAWKSAAVLGLIAGFAERLVPNIMRWTGEQMEPPFGTPSQALRAEEQRTGKQAEPLPNTQAHDVKAKSILRGSFKPSELVPRGSSTLRPAQQSGNAD